MTIKLKGSTDGSVSLQAPADTSPTGTDITLTLPTDAGSANQFLKNSGTAGTLDYSSMVEDSSGNIGISTSSPSSFANFTNLSIQGGTSGSNLDFFNSSGVRKQAIVALANNGLSIECIDAGAINFNTNNTERLRIDSSGRLLVGTTSTATGDLIQILQSDGGSLGLRSDTATGTIGSDAGLGQIRFMDSSGDIYATIQGKTDGASGSGDFPGKLLFSTCADGASSPTERMRIGSNGQTLFTQGNASSGAVAVKCTSTLYNTASQYISVARSNSSSFNFLLTYSSTFSDVEHKLRGDGNAYADGSWNGGGADYAEYFEWSDGNSASEDRRGISVVLDGDKIREAVAGEEPIGVISGNPSVVGDAAWNKWHGRYLRDDFGTYVQEDYEVEDDDGNTVVQQRRKLNPDYDPDVEYVSREDRAEWDCVGLMGKLRIRKGQVTGSRWIKMRDVSDSVEEWLVR